MTLPKILAQGEFGPKDIIVSFSDSSNRKIEPKIERQIDTCWEKLLKDAGQKGQTLWNGTSCRVNALEVINEGIVKVEFAPIEFKTRECLLKIPGYSSLGEDYYRKGAFVSSLVRTVDNYYIFVQLSGLSLNTNKVDVPGGIMGDDSLIRSGQDVFAALYTEIKEEISVSQENIKDCVLRLVFLGVSTNVGFHFDVQLSLERDEILRQFKKHNTDTDIKDLLFVKEKDLSKQLKSMGGSKAFLNQVLYRQG